MTYINDGLSDEEKAKYLSKSKVNTFDFCPEKYRLQEIEKVKVQVNFAMRFGGEFHDYIDAFFKSVRFDADNNMVSYITHYNKLDKRYLKNFLEFEVMRFKIIRKYKPKEIPKYFMPALIEEKIRIHNPKVVGVPDRVHWALDGSLVIVENKTGTPDNKKNKEYENDIIWYKMLLELDNRFPEYKLQRGAIYYPLNNEVHKFFVTDKQVDDLKEHIEYVRECINANHFVPTPTREKCKFCDFKRKCGFSMV